MSKFAAFGLILTIIFSAWAAGPVSQKPMVADGLTTAVAFSTNQLISVNDVAYAHHVEVSMAIPRCT